MKGVICLLAAATAICLSSPASAAQVTCAVENPCGWLSDDGTGGAALGFCVNKVTGDETRIRVARTDGRGAELPPIELATKRLTATDVQAISADGKTKLGGHQGRVGSLTVEKFGFFVYCRW
ncbi:MAG TPA: hypothetical protein VFV50_07615 [Bdellovibrionales bacterium]|nr:hypothetical protein [Bdellovibrionales bacterium]